MADTKISALASVAPADADYVAGVDVSDTTQSPNGTTKRFLFSAIWTWISNQLGTAAFQNVGVSANNVVQLTGAGILPAIDGSALINLPATNMNWSLPVNADIVPNTDGTWDLGTSLNRFAVLHVDTIDLGGTSLDGSSIPLTDTITFVIDGGGSAITAGVKGYLEIPFACTITQVTMLADQSGSIVVDIWKDTYANFPPLDADSITAAAVPTISSAVKSQDTTLTGWTTAIAAGDILAFNVDSATTVTRVTISLKVAL